MTPQDASAAAYAICKRAPIVPVLVVHDALHARPWPKLWSQADCPR